MNTESITGGAGASPDSLGKAFHVVRVSAGLLAETFRILRACGTGRRECQVLWLSGWSDEHRITRVIHPRHSAHHGGFQLDGDWLTACWSELAARHEGIHVQVHTHPDEAFHSATDDAWPAVHTTGFLSLVIPRFAQGEISLADAFLCGIDEFGRWRELEPARWLRIDEEAER